MMGRCKVCRHPAEWHGDRAVSVCVRFDVVPIIVYSTYGGDNPEGKRAPIPMHPMCGLCTGYQEDLPDLYLQTVPKVASDDPVSTIETAPLAS
jgi:hypothetical protein